MPSNFIDTTSHQQDIKWHHVISSTHLSTKYKVTPGYFIDTFVNKVYNIARSIHLNNIFLTSYKAMLGNFIDINYCRQDVKQCQLISSTQHFIQKYLTKMKVEAIKPFLLCY